MTRPRSTDLAAYELPSTAHSRSGHWLTYFRIRGEASLAGGEYARPEKVLVPVDDLDGR